MIFKKKLNATDISFFFMTFQISVQMSNVIFDICLFYYILCSLNKAILLPIMNKSLDQLEIRPVSHTVESLGESVSEIPVNVKSV